MKRFGIYALAIVVASIGTAALEVALGLEERTGSAIFGFIAGVFFVRYQERAAQ